MDTPSQHPVNGPERFRLTGPESEDAESDAGEIEEFDEDAHAAWSAKWAPKCPDGHRQRLRHALAYRERDLCELELRVPLGGDDGGVCQVVVDEREDEVYVRVLVCVDRESHPVIGQCEYTDCPVRIWLDRPLGERAVIDVDTGQALPLRIPPDYGSFEESAGLGA